MYYCRMLQRTRALENVINTQTRVLYYEIMLTIDVNMSEKSLNAFLEQYIIKIKRERSKYTAHQE